MDIFIRNSKKILKDKTNKIILLNAWVSLNVFKTGIKNMIKNNEINKIDPVKPNCSEKIAKTKSVSFSGRKSKLLCHLILQTIHDPSRGASRVQGKSGSC